jgi:hypothetical protein
MNTDSSKVLAVLHSRRARTLSRATSDGALALLSDLAYGPASTRGLQQTRQQRACRPEAKKTQRPLSELRAIARDLGIRGRSRVRRNELQAAIERIAPDRFGQPAAGEKERR